MWNITWHLVSEWGHRLSGSNQVMFPKIEQDKCFIIQHINNKAQFYCRKNGGGLQHTTLCKLYHINLLCIQMTNIDLYNSIEHTMTIFGLCYNVLNKNVCFHTRAADWKWEEWISPLPPCVFVDFQHISGPPL